MADSKDNSGVMEVVAIAALAFFLWWLTRKKVNYIGEPSTTESEIKDEFAADPNFNMNDYCQNTIYRPLSTNNLIPANLLGEGWCYRGDRSAIDETKGFGDAYAEEQAKKYTEMKQDEAILINNKLSVQFRLINSTAAPLTTDILNITNNIAPFNPAPAAPVATDASSVLTTEFDANWLASDDVTGYYLDVATDNGFLSCISGFNNKDVGNVTTYNIPGLSEGTIYYYRTRAYNDVGSSVSSNIITTITICEAPSSTPATDILYDSFVANWEAVIGASGYYLDVATDNLFTSFVTGYNNKDVGNVVNSDVSGLITGENYYYRLRAYNLSGTSNNSSTVTLKTKKLYNDWYLPSLDEVTAMRTNLYLNGIGDFNGTKLYSTSSEFNNELVYFINFATGGAGLPSKDVENLNVRASRTFTSSTIYALGDTGEAGGFIYNIVDNGDSTYTYLEAYLSDVNVSPQIAWSNIQNILIGTATIIGAGNANTIAIIGQAGHVNSHAKLCTDLSTIY